MRKDIRQVRAVLMVLAMSTIEFDVSLCPVDFSDISANAFGQASVLAECMNSRLTMVSASSFEAPPYFTETEI